MCVSGGFSQSHAVTYGSCAWEIIVSSIDQYSYILCNLQAILSNCVPIIISGHRAINTVSRKLILMDIFEGKCVKPVKLNFPLNFRLYRMIIQLDQCSWILQHSIIVYKLSGVQYICLTSAYFSYQENMNIIWELLNGEKECIAKSKSLYKTCFKNVLRRLLEGWNTG